MAISILIGLWVIDEMNFNKSFKNYDCLAQVYHHVTFGEDVITINDVPAAMGEELKNNYPDFEELTIASWPKEHIIH